MYKRNYGKEYEKDKARDVRITIRLHKEISEEFKKKLANENKTMSGVLKELIEKYVNE